MLAFLNRLFRRRPSFSPPVVPTKPLPPTPDGWTIVPCGQSGITVYEVSTVVPRDRPAEKSSGPGSMEMVGVNALAYHEFPPETLEIGHVDVRMETARDIRITYRFNFNPQGWRRPGATIPAFDYHRLPFAADEIAIALT